MRLGTRSVLFGAHQFIIHPIALSIAWTKLYGLPLDPRLWIAFMVHDWGYIGKHKMDDELGESHPELGAAIMRIFGEDWYWFTLLHSRFYAGRLRRPFSRLCVADKLATCIMPSWIYLPLVILSGEVKEYMEASEKYGEEYLKRLEKTNSPYTWFACCKQYMLEWIDAHKHEAVDPWETPWMNIINKYCGERESIGVYRFPFSNLCTKAFTELNATFPEESFDTKADCLLVLSEIKHNPINN